MLSVARPVQRECKLFKLTTQYTQQSREHLTSCFSSATVPFRGLEYVVFVRELRRWRLRRLHWQHGWLRQGRRRRSRALRLPSRHGRSTEAYSAKSSQPDTSCESATVQPSVPIAANTPTQASGKQTACSM